MGLFDELDDEELEMMTTHKDFEPMELTEGNVNAIFNRCVVEKPEDGNDGNYVFSIPFSESLGYSVNSGQALMNVDALAKNKANILYLMGQIKNIGNGEHISLPDLVITYQNRAWTREIEYVLKLIYLTVNKASNILLPFNNTEGKNHTRSITDIEATLSPKDPRFPEWYEGYKARHPEIDFGE